MARSYKEPERVEIRGCQFEGAITARAGRQSEAANHRRSAGDVATDEANDRLQRVAGYRRLRRTGLPLTWGRPVSPVPPGPSVLHHQETADDAVRSCVLQIVICQRGSATPIRVNRTAVNECWRAARSSRRAPRELTLAIGARRTPRRAVRDDASPAALFGSPAAVFFSGLQALADLRDGCLAYHEGGGIVAVRPHSFGEQEARELWADRTAVVGEIPRRRSTCPSRTGR